MKKLIILLPLLMLLTACETKRDWNVNVKLEIQHWNTISVTKFRTEVINSQEVVVDMSEKEIKEYCVQRITMETYGTTLYKYITTKTYSEIK